MPSKGMSVTAARMLVDRMCAKYDIPLLTLHDFDIAGFSIGKTVGSDTRRYSFRNRIRVVDLGLRLADVRTLDLESESVSLGNVEPSKRGLVPIMCLRGILRRLRASRVWLRKFEINRRRFDPTSKHHAEVAVVLLFQTKLLLSTA
jgi:hypothetical protein